MVQTESKFYDGIEVRAQKPLDVRTIVEKREDLYKINTWPHDEYVEGMSGSYSEDRDGNKYVVYMKAGMRITVTGTKENPVFDLYILTDETKILGEKIKDENGNITGWDYYAGWKFIGTGSTPGSGGGSMTGNIDGGRADEYYTPSQIISGGNAKSRGETDDE